MIDTHAHINYPSLRSDLPGILERAKQAGVRGIVVPGTSVEVSKDCLEIGQKYSTSALPIYPALGIHPDAALQYVPAMTAALERLIVEHPEVVAVGEVGLDYYYLEAEVPPEKQQARQRELFSDMIALAVRHDLPIILHSREAFSDIYSMLREQARGHPVIVHCFTGSKEQAYQWLDQGYMLSFTGILTFKKSQALREVAQSIPLERVMLETDAPYLAPEGFRSQPSEPQHVGVIARCLAELHSCEVSMVDAITSSNAVRTFKLQHA